MGLTMGQRRAVTKAIAARYKLSDKAGKGVILDELCALTEWHRNHARKALTAALTPRIVRARKPKNTEVLKRCRDRAGALLGRVGRSDGQTAAPVMAELVPPVRRFGELEITEETQGALLGMAAATTDRRLAGERARMVLRGRSHTKPGSLLRSQIPIRTWAQWDDAAPCFVEIDLVGHEGGNAVEDHCHTLTVTVTDIATGWTENRSVPNKARRWVIAALGEIAAIKPFPVIGLDSDNGSEFINHHLLDWCAQRQITFTRSRPGNSNDGAHMEQKNWAVVPTLAGYHRCRLPRYMAHFCHAKWPHGHCAGIALHPP